MPEKETWKEQNLQDAKYVAKKFGVRFMLLDITRLVEAAKQCVGVPMGQGKIVPYGNIKARLRAMVLYYLANTKHGLVVGTGDKSEIMLGYFTKYGDGACDTQPLADLYKTTVQDLAKHLRLPLRIYSKPASPELWAGQTAEKELGLAYDKLDLVLWGLERWMKPEEIVEETGLSLKAVRGVRDRWWASEHKRRPPLTLKMGYRTSGMDLRLPHTPGQVR
jgi:NAD+ synthase